MVREDSAWAFRVLMYDRKVDRECNDFAVVHPFSYFDITT